MTSARETTLATIRRSLGATPGDTLRASAVDTRLENTPAGIIPDRAQISSAKQVKLLIEMIEAVNATTERVKTSADIPAKVAAFLRANNLPQEIVHGDDAGLGDLNWDTEPQLERTTGRADGSEATGLSRAIAGVAETGTLILTSGPDNPTTINFLPEAHIVVIDAKTIAGDYETIWAGLRKRYGKDAMPRTVNWVTGPSRSADIEQTLLLGAHGPKKLHVIVVG